MKYLKHAKIAEPKLIYEVEIDHSKDEMATKYDDNAWRVLITMGNGVAVDQWQNFVRSNFKNAVNKFSEIVTESQNRTNSFEVYYSVDVTNKVSKVRFFVE